MRQVVVILLIIMAWTGRAFAQANPDESARIEALERQVDELESRLDSRQAAGAATGVVLFTIGTVCALWAQNTRRSAWLWFFLGVFLHVFTLIVLLRKNHLDLEDGGWAGGRGRPDGGGVRG